MRFSEFNENSPAMQAALDAIGATFSPERKKIDAYILDLRRAAEMLGKKSARADDYMKSIGVKDKQDLINKLKSSKESEEEASKDEKIMRSAKLNIRGIKAALRQLGLSEQDLKVTSRAGSKVQAGDGVEIDLDKVDVDVDPTTKKATIKPKGSTPGAGAPKDAINPGSTISLS